MKPCILAGMSALAPSGCANAHLRHNTVTQTRTLTDMRHQIVLRNLAAFAFINPDATPFHATLSYGTAQITDNGSIATQLLNATTRTLTFGAQKTSTDQWTVTPVT